MSHAGPNSQQPRPPGGSTMPAPSSMGLSAAPPGLGRGDDVADLCSSFGALSITAGTSRTPSGPQGSRASQGPNTGGRPCQSTLSGTAGASTTNHPVSGAPSAPPSSHIPRHVTKQRSSSDGCSTASKAVCGGGGVLASPPSGPATLVSKSQSSLATKTPSSPAQQLIRRKRAAPCNKPFSSTSQPTAAVPGLAAAPQVPGAMSHAGPNSQQPRPPGGSTMPAPSSMGLSAAPPGLGRGDDVADLCSSFGALSITAGTSRTPSGPQGSRASQGPNTGGRPCQSTLSGTAGASTTNHP
ncbi:putative protein TPRXL, partial [Lontra canadensis]|uniref:putative protein TPRXL n=1 Tax=Lontra canadensis TaxID=76717 RepID=UPI0013F3391A